MSEEKTGPTYTSLRKRLQTAQETNRKYRNILQRAQSMSQHLSLKMKAMDDALAIANAKISVLDIFDRMSQLMHGRQAMGGSMASNAVYNLQALEREIIEAFDAEDKAFEEEAARRKIVIEEAERPE